MGSISIKARVYVDKGYIYLIINKVNGKMYVGKTRGWEERKRGHKNCKADYYLYRAIRKYGWKNFSFVLWKQTTIDHMGIEECRWVDFFDCLTPKGYNILKPTEKSWIMGKETKEKISKGNKGKIRSVECREKLRKSRVGKPLSEDTKKKISESGKNRFVKKENHPAYGKKVEKEVVEKRLKTMQNRGITFIGDHNPNFGKCASKETRRKMSEARKGERNGMFGKSHTEETKKKLRKIAKEKFKNKINHPMFGRHLSEETKRKISESKKAKRINKDEGVET